MPSTSWMRPSSIYTCMCLHDNSVTYSASILRVGVRVCGGHKIQPAALTLSIVHGVISNTATASFLALFIYRHRATSGVILGRYSNIPPLTALYRIPPLHTAIRRYTNDAGPIDDVHVFYIQMYVLSMIIV